MKVIPFDDDSNKVLRTWVKREFPYKGFMRHSGRAVKMEACFDIFNNNLYRDTHKTDARHQAIDAQKRVLRMMGIKGEDSIGLYPGISIMPDYYPELNGNDIYYRMRFILRFGEQSMGFIDGINIYSDLDTLLIRCGDITLNIRIHNMEAHLQELEEKLERDRLRKERGWKTKAPEKVEVQDDEGSDEGGASEAPRDMALHEEAHDEQGM